MPSPIRSAVPLCGSWPASHSDAVIVVCDVTRPVPNRVMLPPIIEELLAAGIRRDDITILIATGLHRPNEGDELAGMVGSDIATDFRVVNHRATVAAEQACVGRTASGFDVELDAGLLLGLAEDHHRVYRAAPDGRLQRWAQALRDWLRRRADHPSPARPQDHRAPQFDRRGVWRGICSTLN